MGNIKKYGFLLTLVITIFTLGSLKVSAANLELTAEQKMNYYQQYEKIVDEINSSEPDSTLELDSFENFDSEDFIEPLEFKKYALERSKMNFNIVSDSNEITPFSVVTGTKTKSVKSNGTTVSLSIKGSFNTQYNSASMRQMFSGINSITVKPSKGTWTKSTSSGYSARLIDGGRTYEVTASGKLKLNNLTSSHHAVVEFHCSANGSVS